MKKSVGFVAMTRVTEDGPLMTVLQRRGEWNTEKGEPESYPGCIQVTCHGGLEDTDGDSFLEALLREVREELGARFANWLCGNHTRLEILSKVVNDKKQVTTFGAIVTMEAIRVIRLHPDTGGLCWMTAEQVDCIVLIRDDMKQLGPDGLQAMFPDEIEAVKKAFEIFG